MKVVIQKKRKELVIFEIKKEEPGVRFPDNNRVLIYPNPNNGSMTVEYSIKGSALLELTDISGKLVGKYILPVNSSKMQIENEKLENGVYLYRVISGKGLIRTGKIIVMK